MEKPKSNNFFRNKHKDTLLEYEMDLKDIWLSYLVFLDEESKVLENLEDLYVQGS